MRDERSVYFFFTHHLCQGLRRFKIFLYASGEITESILLIFLKKKLGFSFEMSKFYLLDFDPEVLQLLVINIKNYANII